MEWIRSELSFSLMKSEEVVGPSSKRARVLDFTGCANQRGNRLNNCRPVYKVGFWFLLFSFMFATILCWELRCGRFVLAP